MAPLEKKPKQPKAERVTYRQESVGIAVLEFVQNLLMEDADVSGADIVPTIVEVSHQLVPMLFGHALTTTIPLSCNSGERVS